MTNLFCPNWENQIGVVLTGGLQSRASWCLSLLLWSVCLLFCFALYAEMIYDMPSFFCVWQSVFVCLVVFLDVSFYVLLCRFLSGWMRPVSFLLALFLSCVSAFCRSVCLSACLLGCLSVCLFVNCMYAGLHICFYVRLYVCVSLCMFVPISISLYLSMRWHVNRQMINVFKSPWPIRLHSTPICWRKRLPLFTFIIPMSTIHFPCTGCRVVSAFPIPLPSRKHHLDPRSLVPPQVPPRGFQWRF